MTEDRFWTLIASARSVAGASDQAFLTALHATLMACSLDEIRAFDHQVAVQSSRAYRSELWAAAYLINGGCSDDCFEYFRAWLIAQGREVFEAAVRDPAALVDAIVMDSGWDAELEEFLFSARAAYNAKAGEDMPWSPPPSTDLQGADWDEDTVEEMYPALRARAEQRWG